MATVDTAPVLPPFLQLPFRIRLRIYGHALILDGSVRKKGYSKIACPRWINLGRRPDSDCWHHSDSRSPRAQFAVTHALLLTCHVTNRELNFLVYRSQHFFIRYIDAGSLEPLRRLRPDVLRWIRRLTVHLNVACKSMPSDPVGGAVIWPWLEPRVATERNQPLNLADPNASVGAQLPFRETTKC